MMLTRIQRRFRALVGMVPGHYYPGWSIDQLFEEVCIALDIDPSRALLSPMDSIAAAIASKPEPRETVAAKPTEDQMEARVQKRERVFLLRLQLYGHKMEEERPR